MHSPLNASHPAPLPRLIIDDRELHGPMLAALRELGEFEIEIKRLKVGDYVIDQAFAFERKTLTDLVESIKQGRLFSQALRLSKSKLRSALILEGTSADLAGSAMRWEAIQGALLTVTLFIGIPILRTRSPTETARTMLYAARQHATYASGALPRRGFRPQGKPALQRHILQGLPGIGPDRASQLLQRFGNIESALTADTKALIAVPGIGPKTARRIRWAVEESAPIYSWRAAEARTTSAGSVPVI